MTQLSKKQVKVIINLIKPNTRDDFKQIFTTEIDGAKHWVATNTYLAILMPASDCAIGSVVKLNTLIEWHSTAKSNDILNIDEVAILSNETFPSVSNIIPKEVKPLYGISVDGEYLKLADDFADIDLYWEFYSGGYPIMAESREGYKFLLMPRTFVNRT